MDSYLMHHGVKGQKWGIRKYQDENGKWTEEGLERRRNFDSRLKDYTNYNIEKEKYIRKKRDEYYDSDYKNSIRTRDARRSLLYGIYSKNGLKNALKRSALSKKQISEREQNYKKDVDKFVSKLDKKYKMSDIDLEIDSKIYADMVNDIFNSMSGIEKNYLAGQSGYRREKLLTDERAEDMLKNGSAFIEMQKDIPVSFLYADDGYITIGSRSGEKYRNKGYASKNIEKAKKWCDEREGLLIYEAYTFNTPSNNLAKKHDFTSDYFNKYNSADYDDNIYYYSKDHKLDQEYSTNYDEKLDKELRKAHGR